MPEPIITAGYASRTPEGLKAFAESLGAAIVDIRFSPRSRNAQWNWRALNAGLGERYHHVKALGNKNYKGGPIEILAPRDGEAQVKEILQTWSHVILLCLCRDLDKCHRKVVAEFLSERLSVGWEEAAQEALRSDLPSMF